MIPMLQAVLAVAHDQYRHIALDGLRALGAAHAVIYDIKGMLPRQCVDTRL